MSILEATISTIFAIIRILGIWFAIRAILISRTPQSAIGWSLALLTIPEIAIPLFLVFGQSRFSGYLVAARGSSGELGVELHGMQAALEPHKANFGPMGESAASVAFKLSGLPATNGNHVSLLIDGDQTFQAIFKAIDEAEAFIIIQFFIIRDDAIGKDLLDHLRKALDRGVRVWFLYDGVGSKSLPLSYIQSLKEAGAEVAGFITNRKIGTRFQLNFRNHRKLVLVDGAVAFLGGLNVGDEYLGRSERFGPWRDTHIRIEGPAVQSLQLPFVEDWNYATGNVLHLPRHAQVSSQGNTSIFILASGPASRLHIPLAVLMEIIYRTKKRLWLASPYFVPDSAFRAALKHAALRGVDVRILLPQNPDHLLPFLSSYSFYPGMRNAGVKIYRYQPGFMHQKVILADEEIAIVGSLNLDYRSFMLNFELSAGVEDPQFIKEIEAMFLHDFEKSHEEDLGIYDSGSLWFRLKVRLAALLSPEQ